jgi:hypothetical protein
VDKSHPSDRSSSHSEASVLVAGNTSLLVLVGVAEDTSAILVGGIHDLGDWDAVTEESGHLKHGCGGDCVTGAVGEHEAANSLAGSLLLSLPEPVDVINLSVVKEEEWVIGCGPDVGHLEQLALFLNQSKSLTSPPTPL